MEYQFPELKKKELCKEKGYQQCLQTQRQQNYLVSNINNGWAEGYFRNGPRD
jgi:hypothetical protein